MKYAMDSAPANERLPTVKLNHLSAREHLLEDSQCFLILGTTERRNDYPAVDVVIIEI
jgi:hypothetical protein